MFLLRWPFLYFLTFLRTTRKDDIYYINITKNKIKNKIVIEALYSPTFPYIPLPFLAFPLPSLPSFVFRCLLTIFRAALSLRILVDKYIGFVLNEIKKQQKLIVLYGCLTFVSHFWIAFIHSIGSGHWYVLLYYKKISSWLTSWLTKFSSWIKNFPYWFNAFLDLLSDILLFLIAVLIFIKFSLVLWLGKYINNPSICSAIL